MLYYNIILVTYNSQNLIITQRMKCIVQLKMINNYTHIFFTRSQYEIQWSSSTTKIE